MKKNGFSLIELAIVLVIVAILIGGLMIGKSMLASARIQSVVSDWQKYSNAATTYFTKYNYWPGDDAERSVKWNAGLGNGNGDGSLGASNGDAEFMYFWYDLAAAGLITGNYSGLYTATAPTLVVPKTQIPNSFMTHYYIASTNQQFYLTGTNPISAYSKVGYSGETVTYVLSPTDALSIDTKIDDAQPTTATGNVIATGGASCYTSATAYAAGSTATCNLYYVYKR